MREIEHGEVQGIVPPSSFNGTLKRIFDMVQTSVVRGLSLGLVLFLALGTLSFLNRGSDFVEASFRSKLRPVRVETRNVALPRVYSGLASVYPSRPLGTAVSRESRQDMVRESTYLLDALERLSHTLGRFGR